MSSPLRVAIVGSGSWGTAVARRVALNILDGTNESFSGDVLMWVYEEIVDGRKLTEIINTDHMNRKYLPGVVLPASVVACDDLTETCKDADVILFVIPHQFIRGVLDKMKDNIKPDSIGVSLIKGLDVGPRGPKLLSKMIKDKLSLTRDVAVVMGANVASEVSKDQFVESTVACQDPHVAALATQLLNCHSLHIDTCADVATVEICGALKNVVAMGGGKIICMRHSFLGSFMCTNKFTFVHIISAALLTVCFALFICITSTVLYSYSFSSTCLVLY
jgi:glycerol-3-phosphate dehydrogenase (NAD+)